MKPSTRNLVRFAVLALLLALGSFLIPYRHAPPYVAPPMPLLDPPPDGSLFVPPSPANPAPPTPGEIKSAAVLTPEFADPNGGPPIMPALPLQQGELPWEAQLRAITSAPNLPDREKARRLLALMPGLAVEGRETATEDAVKLVTNADYTVAKPVLLNPGTYGPALNVLFADLAERPPEIALPTLLELARIPQHPFAPNARENLQLLLGADYGTDWNRWDTAIRAALAAKK